jgi:phosphoserine phosphatase RsbU/P
MALGVVEGSRIGERDLTLEPGDFLVLYTDGVTDAFSPEGLNFDYERLYQSVWEAVFDALPGTPSASSVLHAIDIAVEDFTHGAAPFDDSTVLIVFRQEI